MSINPKLLNKKKDKYTTFHMRINNCSNEEIQGYIEYKIQMPDGCVDEINYNRTEIIKPNSEIDIYDKYYINNKYKVGRYYVEGRFYWDGQNILSDTHENDYFDIIEEDV